MKRLSDYTKKRQTELFNECGAFFAFSEKQLHKKQKEGIKYASLGHGLICDKRHSQRLIDGLGKIQAQSINQDLEDNGVKNIIWRELANYESQITMSIADTVEALEPYNINKERILKEWKGYLQHCIDNDYF